MKLEQRIRRANSPRTSGTIKDVAAEAGVSIASVSHVLNGTRPVSLELRERVLGAARRLNYHPSASARGLRLGNGPLIELLLPNLGPACARIAEAAAAEASACGSRLAVSTSNIAAPPETAVNLGSPAWPDWRPLPADVVVDLLADEQDPGRRGGSAVGAAPRITLFCPQGPGLSPSVDLYGAVRLLSTRMLTMGKLPAVLWHTGEPGMFGSATLARLAEEAVAETVRSAGYGRGAVRSVVVDSDHLTPNADLLARLGQQPGVIVNGPHALAALHRAGQDPRCPVAILDPLGLPLAPYGGLVLAIEWRWAEAGRTLVHAALARACNQDVPPIRVPYRVVAGRADPARAPRARATLDPMNGSDERS